MVGVDWMFKGREYLDLASPVIWPSAVKWAFPVIGFRWSPQMARGHDLGLNVIPTPAGWLAGCRLGISRESTFVRGGFLLAPSSLVEMTGRLHSCLVLLSFVCFSFYIPTLKGRAIDLFHSVIHPALSVSPSFRMGHGGSHSTITFFVTIPSSVVIRQKYIPLWRLLTFTFTLSLPAGMCFSRSFRPLIS